MKIINVVLVLAGLTTLAVNAAADPVIVMPPVVIVVPRPRPHCSAPRPIQFGSSERIDRAQPAPGTVRVCEGGAL